MTVGGAGNFRERKFASYDKEGFSGFDVPEESKKVSLDVLDADGTHTSIVPKGARAEHGRKIVLSQDAFRKPNGFLRNPEWHVRYNLA